MLESRQSDAVIPAVDDDASVRRSRRRLMRQTGLARIALGALAVLLGSLPVRALDPLLDISQYAHTAWSGRNGFVNGEVYAIAQTGDGYLWLGTQSGVVRFDGRRTVPLPLRPGQQLPNTAAGAVLPARDGTLWIGTLDGLVSWKSGQLTGYPELARRTVVTLLQDRNGTVWAGAFGGTTGRLCAIRGGSINCYGDDGAFGAGVWSLYEDSQGSLWVGSATGLWRWSPGRPSRYLTTTIPGRQTLTRGDHGSDLIAAVDSLRQIAGTKVTDYLLRGVPSPLTATSVLRDRNGGLWIGTSAHGLVHAYQSKTSLFTHNDGLSSDQVYALFEDRDGTIWVATSGGLDQFRELPVTSLSVKEGLSSATVTSVVAARDGSIWIGTADGLNRWHHGHVTIYRTRSHPGLPGDAIQSLFEDEHGRIWVSGLRGLAVFENDTFTATHSVPAGDKHAIATDNHGGLWLSSSDSGLAHLVDGKIIEQASWQQLGGGPGTGLVSDPDGGVWTGLLSGGLAYFRAGQIRKLPLNADGSGAPKVFDLSRDRSGALWVPSQKGLIRVMNGHIATLTTANGLPCNAVHWIIEDDLSSYWLYMPCGLVRIARTDLDAWTADVKRTIQVTTFDAADGIRLVPMLKGFRPFVTKWSDGKIWFVNSDTVSFFDPSRIDINTLPPPVHIEQVTADRKKYSAIPGLRLPPGVRDLIFDFEALNLVAPEKVQYRFKLEGYDRDWNTAVDELRVEYTNLPPRKYRFRVTASNNGGVWNEKGDALDFSIAPAYYQTNWFRALLAAAMLALLWAAYELRVRQLERESKQLRDVVETIPANVWSARPDGSVDFMNRRWLEFSGLSPDKALGWGWADTLHPEDRGQFLEKLHAGIQSGEAIEAEARMRRADGQYRWLLFRNVPLRDKSGKIVKWYGKSTDIDDRKHAEEEVRNTGAQWQATFDAVQDLVLLLDKDFRILRANHAAAGFLGLPFDKIVGGHCYDLIHRMSTPPGECPLAKMRQSGRHEQAEVLARPGGPWLSVSVDPIFDASGELTQVVHVARDITDRKRAEEALHESETRFRTFVDHAGDALFVYDLERRTVVDVNRSACESLGYTRQELVGQTPFAFHLDSYQADMDSFAERAVAGETVIESHWHRRKDGTVFPVEVHTTLIVYDGRRFLLMVARDITDRVRAEEAIRQSEKQLRDVIDTIPGYVWSALPDGPLDFLSKRCLEFSGDSFEESLGPGWEHVLHPEDRDRFLEEARAAFAAGEPFETEARYRRADGQYRWLLVRAVPMRDEKGTILKWYGANTDIDDRKRAEEALKRSEAYLADAQRLTHTGAWACDFTTRPLYWSDEVFRIYGFDPQHGLPDQEQPLERVHPEDRDRFWHAFQRTICQKVDNDVEYRVLLPDGRLKHVYALAHPVLNSNGDLVEVVGTIVDITERKRAEEERERLRELEADLAHIDRVSMMGELAASIAHEVNQPLAGIVSNGSACLRWLAGDQPNVQEAREAVRDIIRDGKRAGEIIARIRAMTKRSAPPREKLDVTETIREVLALVGDEAKRKNVVIRTQFAGELSPVSGDRVQLQQVVLNLVMNAIDAMSSVVDRERQLVITTENMGDERVQVTVEDSGTGLDPNTMARIFEPFYTTKSGGMGMGLSISRSILQNHGGRLWATLNQGPGTSFHFTLPKDQGEESHAGAAAD